MNWVIAEVSKEHKSILRSQENWRKYHPMAPIKIEPIYIDIHSEDPTQKSKIKSVPGYKDISVITITDFSEIKGYTLYVDPPSILTHKKEIEAMVWRDGMER